MPAELGSILFPLLAALLGALVTWVLRSAAVEAEARRRLVAEERAARLPAVEGELRRSQDRVERLQQALAQAERRNGELATALEKDQEAATRLQEALRQSEQQLSEHFGALSQKALGESTRAFLELAKAELGKLQASSQGELDTRHARFEELVKPFREALEKLDGKVHTLEKVRATAYDGVLRELSALREVSHGVRAETGNLVKALRAPHVRGMWGEMQLRRVVELAGMQRHCDFVEQASSTKDEQRLRPDLLVTLPGKRVIVVDAKTPCAAYLEALEAPEEEARQRHLDAHARQVAEKVEQLASKAYASHVEGALELVVLFLPAEPFLSAALERDPGLLERAFDRNVLLATPMTLMSLLRAIAHGWKQQDIAENAQQVARLGTELYERLCVLGEHFSAMGQSLGKAVKSYNAGIGSLESRVLPHARRFQELGVLKTHRELPVLEVVAEDVRALRAEDWGASAVAAPAATPVLRLEPSGE